MKTNDVSGRYGRGEVGFAVELGRPGTGARLTEMEKITMALVSHGVAVEENNPAYRFFADPTTGKLKGEVLNEKVLSAIFEFKTTPDMVSSVLETLRNISQTVDTVFSVDMISMLEPDGTCPAEDAARSAGFELRPNGKNNIGLGRPLALP